MTGFAGYDMPLSYSGAVVEGSKGAVAGGPGECKRWTFRVAVGGRATSECGEGSPRARPSRRTRLDQLAGDRFGERDGLVLLRPTL